MREDTHTPTLPHVRDCACVSVCVRVSAFVCENRTRHPHLFICVRVRVREGENE